ncbi:MAG: hypothetical protein HQL57_08470 [Magnetococcales bacterium]|nr:hypothetical protein [Magnetococcales bacterium]
MKFMIGLLVRLRFAIGIGALYGAQALLFFRAIMLIFFLVFFSNHCLVGYICTVNVSMAMYLMIASSLIVSSIVVISALLLMIVSRVALGEWRRDFIVAYCVQTLVLVIQEFSQKIS